MKLAAIPALATMLLASTAARGDLLPIDNAGFEAFYQGMDVLTGSFPVGPPPDGWTRYDENGAPVAGSLLGVLNPGTQADYDADGGGLSPCFPDGAPEGDNVALLFKSGGAAADEYGIEQQLVDVLEAGMRYSLSVEVGNIQTCAGLPPGFRTTFNLDGFPGYRIELRAGNELLVSDDDTLLPPEGEFETSSITYTAPAGHPELGEPLVIRLVSLNQSGTGDNLEVDFDDVRLDAVPATPLPIPPLAGWLEAALLAAWGARRARAR